MTWFKVDDGFHSHPKVLACSLAAVGLWARAGSWCSDHEGTRGEIPNAVLSMFGAKPKLAQELVDAGLWDKTETGWRFHDWDIYQPSAEELEEKRRKNAEKQQRWRERNPEHNRLRQEKRNQVTNPPPVPTRPDPLPEEELRTPPNARDGGSPFRVGHDFLRDALGNQYGEEWRADLERIGMKPDAERKTVLAAIKSSSWCRENKHAVDPKHVLRQWPRYLAGDPPLKQVARAASGGKYAGPSQVAAPEDYAVKGEIKW